MIDKPIVGLATWLSRPAGFLATCLVVAAGIGLGVALSWSEAFTLAFNLALSIAALVFAGVILVAGAKDTASLQAKLDNLISSIDKADNRLIGIERRDTEELERLRS